MNNEQKNEMKNTFDNVNLTRDFILQQSQKMMINQSENVDLISIQLQNLSNNFAVALR